MWKFGTSPRGPKQLKNREALDLAERGAAVLRQIHGNYQLDLNFCRLELLSGSKRPIGARGNYLLDEFRIDQSRGITPA